MSATRIYLMWHHDEYGPDALTATSDPTMLEAMALSYNSDPANPWVKEREITKLREALPGMIESQRVVALHDGWGGLHVQSVDMIGPAPSST